MRKKTKKNRKNLVKKKRLQKVSFLDNFARFFEKRTSFFLYFFPLATLAFSLLLFDLKIGVGGDDSAYIKRAYDLVHLHRFPAFQAPFYPILLSPFIAIWGIQLGLLKLLSTAFITASIYLIFKSLNRNIPTLILFPALLILVGNAPLLFYASQTYVEAFFLFTQSILIWFFFKYFITEMPEKEPVKQYQNILLLGFILFLNSITKNIGIASLLVVTIYFLLEKSWKPALYTILSFAAFFVVFQLLKSILWSESTIQMQTQAQTLLLKNAYSLSEGNETLGGFFERFLENSQIYLSKHLFYFLGLRERLAVSNLWGTLATFGLFFLSLYMVFKKNKYLTFIALHLIFMYGITFVVLQTVWDSGRMIIVFFPLTLIFLLSGLYFLKDKIKADWYHAIYIAFVGVLFATTWLAGAKKVAAHLPIIQENLRGNKVAGLSPDWVNFINMSEYAASLSTDTVMVACRKPDVSFIYTGQPFYGIFKVPMQSTSQFFDTLQQKNIKYTLLYELQIDKKVKDLRELSLIKKYNIGFWNIPIRQAKQQTTVVGVYRDSIAGMPAFSEIIKHYNLPVFSRQEALDIRKKNLPNAFCVNADSLIMPLKKRNVRYVIKASLRKYEQRKTKETINTVMRYLTYILRKYPAILQKVHKIGQDESAELYRIVYENYPQEFEN